MITLLLVCLLFIGVHSDYAPEFDIPTVDTVSLSITFTMEFIDTLTKSLIPYIEFALPAIDIDNFSGEVSTSIGDISFSIENILITTMDIGSAFVILDQENDSFTLGFNGTKLDVSFGYSYQLLSWPYTEEEGSGAVIIDDLLMQTSLLLGQDKDTAGMHIDILDMTININSFTVHLEGGILAAVVDIIEDLFADSINEVIEDLLMNVLYTVLQEYLDYFNGSLLADCDGDICVDIRLAQNMIMSSSSGTFQMGGTAFWGKNQSLYVSPDEWPGVPNAVNERAIQYIWGQNTISTYLKALDDAGYFMSVTCDSDDTQSCGMTNNAAAYLSFDEIAEGFPEFAEAFPDFDMSVYVELTAPPDPTILYSAIQISFDLYVAVAPFDPTTSKTGDVAAEFSATVEVAADVDFREYHGAPADTPITWETHYVTFELSKYSIAAVPDSSSIGDIAVTSEFEDWLENVLFETAIGAQWSDSLYEHSLEFLRCDLMAYINRAVVYDSDYVAMTVDVQISDHPPN